MDMNEIKRLSALVNFDHMTDPANVEALRHLSQAEREEFARATGSLVLYFGDEVAACQREEEEATLTAAPPGYSLELLNGLNIGCGNRLISPYLTPVDIMRYPPSQQIGGEHAVLTPSAFLALPDALPFRPGSIDYIVALHTLEHISDPVRIILHWLDVLKPGGGIGIVVPDWRYTWDARSDEMPYGHKWNSCPDLVTDLYRKHWFYHCELERIDTLPFKLSFDFVLRKHGLFQPFSRMSLETALSGHQRAESGMFLALGGVEVD